MKKIIITISALIIGSTALFAQNEEDRKGYVGLSFGTSTPIGDFASKDVKNNAAGLANQGFMLDASFGYRVAKNFGVLALLRIQGNSVDAQTLADALAQQNPGYKFSTTTTGWTLVGTMGGVYGTFPLFNGRSAIDIKGAIGFLTATAPELNVTGTNGTSTAFVKQESASATAFAYMIGAGYRYNITDAIGLLVNLDYLGANPEFKDVKTSDSNGRTSTNTYTQSFGTINYTIGVAYRLK